METKRIQIGEVNQDAHPPDALIVPTAEFTNYPYHWSELGYESEEAFMADCEPPVFPTIQSSNK